VDKGEARLHGRYLFVERLVVRHAQFYGTDGENKVGSHRHGNLPAEESPNSKREPEHLKERQQSSGVQVLQGKADILDIVYDAVVGVLDPVSWGVATRHYWRS
jgi:hypothetical protein